MTKNRLSWTAAAGCAVFLFVVSVVPVAPSVSWPYLDKVAHLCEYLVFAWLLAFALRTNPTPVSAVPRLAWIFATGYGALIELAQALIPWRSAEIADAVMNGVGAALGVWIAHRD